MLIPPMLPPILAVDEGIFIIVPVGLIFIPLIAIEVDVAMLGIDMPSIVGDVCWTIKSWG